MRLLLDEHISPDVAMALRAKGIDAVSVIDEGLRTQDDQTVWDTARAEGRVVVTYNRDDFLALAVQAYQGGVRHPGLVIVSPKTIRQSDVGGLVRSLEVFAGGDEPAGDQVIFLRRSARSSTT